MVKKPALPSRLSGKRPARVASSVHEPSRTNAPQRPTRVSRSRTVDVKDWLGGVRFSWFMFIMFALVVLAVLVLVPTVGTYVGQMQHIRQLEESVHVAQDRLDDLKNQREQWSDPAFVTTQARERLSYVRPGELVYLVQNDLDPATVSGEPSKVSTNVEESDSDWMGSMLRGVVDAGLSKNVADQTAKPAQ